MEKQFPSSSLAQYLQTGLRFEHGSNSQIFFRRILYTLEQIKKMHFSQRKTRT